MKQMGCILLKCECHERKRKAGKLYRLKDAKDMTGKCNEGSWIRGKFAIKIIIVKLVMFEYGQYIRK